MHILSLLIGIFLTSISLFFLILYTNLLTMGYSFLEFVQFISTRLECLLFILGLIIILFSFERGRNYVLLLRHFIKFWQ